MQPLIARWKAQFEDLPFRRKIRVMPNVAGVGLGLVLSISIGFGWFNQRRLNHIVQELALASRIPAPAAQSQGYGERESQGERRGR